MAWQKQYDNYRAQVWQPYKVNAPRIGKISLFSVNTSKYIFIIFHYQGHIHATLTEVTMLWRLTVSNPCSIDLNLSSYPCNPHHRLFHHHQNQKISLYDSTCSACKGNQESQDAANTTEWIFLNYAKQQNNPIASIVKAVLKATKQGEPHTKVVNTISVRVPVFFLVRYVLVQSNTGYRFGFTAIYIFI